MEDCSYACCIVVETGKKCNTFTCIIQSKTNTRAN